MEDDRELKTAEELAEVLRVNPVTIQRMAKRGEIPFVAVGPKIRRFVVEEVVAALKNKQGS